MYTSRKEKIENNDNIAQKSHNYAWIQEYYYTFKNTHFKNPIFVLFPFFFILKELKYYFHSFYI